MNGTALLIVGVVTIAILLAGSGSIVFVHTVDAASKKYKVNVDANYQSDCWYKTVVKLNDGVFGKNLAKTSFKIDPQSDDSSGLWHSVTLKFDGKKVKKGDIQVILDMTGKDGGFIESVYDYQHFNKKQMTYNFEFNDLVACGGDNGGGDNGGGDNGGGDNGFIMPGNGTNGNLGGSVDIARGSSFASNGKYFVPNSLTIQKGTYVEWTNNDNALHTVTSGSAESGNSGTEFDSSYLNAGKTFVHQFGTSGTFDYYCTLHPFMKGKVVVK